MRRQFGHIETLEKNKLYRCRWYANGHRKSKHIHGTRKDAEKYLALVELGLVGMDNYTTYNRYWASVIEPSISRLAPKTQAEYERLWRVELQPRIGHLRVSDTTFRNAQRVISDIDAPSVQVKCKRLWHKVCRMAIEQDGLLEVNPISRDIYTKPIKRHEKTLIQVQDIPTFMRYIRGTKYELLLLCELGAGLSPEEACALTMADFQTDGLYVLANINKTLVTVKSKKVLQPTTKNRFRTRECVIGSPFAERIIELIQDTSAPICPSNMYREGRERLTEVDYTSPLTISHNWKLYCKRNSFPYTSQANMRTSWSTLQGEAGSPDGLCSLAMGHAPQTTRGKNYQANTRRGMVLIADNLAQYIAENTLS